MSDVSHNASVGYVTKIEVRMTGCAVKIVIYERYSVFALDVHV